MTFKDLQDKYDDMIISISESIEIESNPEVLRIENNGISSKYIGCVWYTAYDNKGNEINYYL